MRWTVAVAMLLLVGCSRAAAPAANGAAPATATPISSQSPFAPPLPTPTVRPVTPSPIPAGPLKWAAPARVNHLPDFGGSSLSAVSCPSSSLCVAVDDAGNVAASTNPTGGATAWTVTKVDGTNALVGLSCPTIGLCVAIDSTGNVVTTTDPTSAAAWTVTNVDGSNHLSAVSCATATLCVVGDRAGNVISSTNPTGGAAAWQTSLLDASRPVIALTCLATGFCVAARQISPTEGEVLLSADPTGGSTAWTFAIGGPALYGLSCPSRDLCVGIEHIGTGYEQTGTIYTFSTASGVASGLTAANLSDERPIGLTDVSCPSAGICLAADTYGEVLISTHPTGSAATWTIADVGSGAGLTAISCPSTSFCASVTSTGRVITSNNPTKGTTWRESNLIGSNSFNAISCPDTHLCVAAGEGGSIVTSTAPTAGAAAWTVTRVDAAGGLSGVSCPTPSFCVAVDFSTGNILVSTDPTGGATTWTTTKVAQANALNAVSCPTASFCVAIDSFGNAFVSTDPADGTSAWKLAHIYGTSCAWTVTQVPPQCILTSVSCPTDNLCVVGDAVGDVIVSTNPAGGPAYWKTSHVGGEGCNVGETGAPCWFTGMSCPTIKLCVSSDASGRVFTSTNPAGGAKAWHGFVLPAGGYLFDGVSCTDVGFCAVLGDDNEAGGHVLTSSNPTGGPKAWTAAAGLGSTNMRGISCASRALCVVIDVNGEVTVGTPRD